jgi:hypothetical protein
VIVVADGNAAEEVHLGFAKDSANAPSEPAKTGTGGTRAQGQGETSERSKASAGQSTGPADAATAARNTARHKEATKLEEQDDEDEILGHVKSFDESRRILVITLLNGKSRSFMLARDVPVSVKGKASKQGVAEPELKAGAAVTVVTDEGGRKVKELKIVPASDVKRRKAG